MAKYLTFIAGSDIDYFYEVENFLNAGDACIASPLDSKVGGCVVNAACVASSLGSTVKVLDYLKEDDEGTKLIVDALNSHHVDTTSIKYGKDVVNGNCLIMKKDNEKCIYVIDPKKPYYEIDTELKDLIFNSSYIYTLMKIMKDSFSNLDIIKEAKEKGVKIIFDGGSQFIEEYERDYLINLADGLFMNQASYERFVKTCQKDPLKEMFDRGLEFACITDGDKGTTMYTSEGMEYEPARKVEVVDSTGAGDSFAGSFLHFLNSGYDLKTCLHLASNHGAYACTKEGGLGGCLSEKELLEYIKH